MTAALDVLLLAGVLLAWLGCLGFVRLADALDRLHCATFINVAAGTAFTLVAFLADGASNRAGKVVLVLVFSLVAGAAQSHAIGRALRHRAAHAAPELE